MQRWHATKKIVLACWIFLFGGHCVLGMARSQARSNLFEGISPEKIAELRAFSATVHPIKQCGKDAAPAPVTVPRSLPIPIPVGCPLDTLKKK